MIQVNGLTKKFGDFTALSALDCTIPAGCIYGLVGSNGAGKSTLLRLICGIYRPDKGNVTLDGRNIYENPELKEKLVFVPDELYFLPQANMLRMAQTYASFYPRFDRSRFGELTDAFKLNPKANLGTFSKGMRRQAATVLALACKTDFLFLDETFDGLEDNVLVAGNTRTPFGEFRKFYSDPVHRWNAPKAEDIAGAKVAGIDPYFGEDSVRAAEMCREMGKPYVTIDCAYDSPMHRLSAVNVVSNEFYREHYKQEERDQVLQKYMDASDGLTIFTLGAKEIRFGRKGGKIRSFEPYQVDVVSTLGAGDAFKAGCVYALWAGMDDLSTVRFAAACAAVACTRFPLPLNPPQLAEVLMLMSTRGNVL